MNRPSSLDDAASPPAAPADIRPDLRSLRSFAEFYPHYLREHSNRSCRRLHFAGTTLSLLAVVAALMTRRAELLLLAPICGYGGAWIGHFVFEHNKPASFVRPLYSFMGDYVMYRDMWTGKVRL